MIARNELPRHQQKIGRRKIQQMTQAMEKQAKSQITINAVMWQIIKEHAKDPDGDAVLNIPIEDFKDVPALFHLEVLQDENNVMIKASVKEEKRIIRLSD